VVPPQDLDYFANDRCGLYRLPADRVKPVFYGAPAQTHGWRGIPQIRFFKMLDKGNVL